MKNKQFITMHEGRGSKTRNRWPSAIKSILIVCSLVITATSCHKPNSPFDVSRLVVTGDTVSYGSYIVYKIGEGIYKINDPGTTTGRYGAWGVDMYLICGSKKALMIDLGNNYIDGCKQDLIDPRENAAQELRDVVYGLIGKLPLEITVSHMHPDHNGMAGAFLDSDVIFWAGEGENVEAIQKQHNIDPSVFQVFKHCEKQFDLGGGRIVETLLLRGHSNGHTVFLLKKDLMLFTIDAYGNGVGQTFRSVESLKLFTEDAQKMVDYLSSTLTPYERYGLRVYVGHTWLNVYSPYYSPGKEKTDLGYLDWRYAQNLLSCAKGILEGKWLIEGSGLLYVGNMAQVNWWGTAGQAIMVYDLGTIIIPIERAYEAAGLTMPEDPKQ